MARGAERAPLWAVIVMTVGAVFLAAGGFYAANRTHADPLSPAEQSSIAARASAARASDAAAAPKPVLFLGDSYSAGTGASTSANRWTTLVAQAQHWIEGNDAFGGTGYVTALSGDRAQQGCARSSCPNYDQAIARAKGAHPALIIVSGGRNDLPAVGPGYADGVAKFFTDLHATFPQARIVATSPLWDDGPAPAKLAQIAQAVQTGVQAVGGTYLDIGQPLAGHPELVASDGIHPDDAGHKAIADATDAALASVGLQ